MHERWREEETYHAAQAGLLFAGKAGGPQTASSLRPTEAHKVAAWHSQTPRFIMMRPAACW